MSLSTSIVLKVGSTALTPTGGTDTTFVNNGTGVGGKKVLVDSSQADPVLRKKLITDVVVGAVGSNGGLAKLHRQNMTFHQPYKDANGVVYPLPTNLTIPYHPSMTAGEREAHFWNALVAFADSELANLRNMLHD